MAKKRPKSGAPKGNQNAVKSDDEKRSKRLVTQVTEEDAEQAKKAVDDGDYKTVSDLIWKGLQAELKRNTRRKKSKEKTLKLIAAGLKQTQKFRLIAIELSILIEHEGDLEHAKEIRKVIRDASGIVLSGSRL